MSDILIIAAITALCTQAYTWAFPLLDKIREYLDPWADLPIKATMADYLRYGVWKLTTCSLCIGFWSGLFAGSILLGWRGILVAVCSSVMAEILDRVANK